MASPRVADLEPASGAPAPAYRPPPGRAVDRAPRQGARRLSDVSDPRGKRFAAQAQPPVVLDPAAHRRRINPNAVASAVQFADFVAVLAAGIASVLGPWGYRWPLAAVPAVAAALVLALMVRMPKPGPHIPRDLIRQPFPTQLREGIVHALAAFGFSLLAVVALLQPGEVERSPLIGWLSLWALIAVAGIAAIRVAVAGLRARWRAAGRLKQAVAIYGTGDLAARLVERLQAACPTTIEIVGVFDDRAGRHGASAALAELAHGATAELVELSRQLEIDRIIVALPHSAEKRLLEILRKLHKMPVEISLAPDMVGFNVPAKGQDEFDGLPLLDVYGRPLSFGQSLVKTAFDRVAAAAGVVLLSPVLAIVALAIKLDSKGPVLFRQNRYGFGDRVIQVYKFRTMKVEASDANGERQTEVNDPRLTRIGGLLRRTSLDELPQLFNVLRGELSLVGPRPHAISMKVKQRRNEDIVPDYALRHHVKPGITGWAQVNGYHGPVETERHLHQRVAYDIEYINHWSLWFDIRILLRTVCIAFCQRRAY